MCKHAHYVVLMDGIGNKSQFGVETKYADARAYNIKKRGREWGSLLFLAYLLYNAVTDVSECV